MRCARWVLPAVLMLTTMAITASTQNVSPDQEAESLITNEGMLTMIVATYAESNEQLRHVVYLAESLREFGGAYREATLWVFTPDSFSDPDPATSDKLNHLRVEQHRSHIPEPAQAYFFAGKVFAAALAETMAESISAVLVWMDEDTIILREPDAFALPEGIAFAYRPVMHNRSGALYAEPPSKFWSRIYRVLDVSEDRLFPMITPADQATIRAYFNAGLLIVRPESGVLRAWADDFSILYSDSVLTEMCGADVEKRIFLHQTALVGAVLNRLDRDQMVELSEEYNYPLFFHRQYEAAREFGSIDGITTLRYDTYFRHPDPNWKDQLTGAKNRTVWLSKRLGTP